MNIHVNIAKGERCTRSSHSFPVCGKPSSQSLQPALGANHSPTNSSLPASARHASMALSQQHLYCYTLSVPQILALPSPLRDFPSSSTLCDAPLLNFQNPPPTCCLSELLTPFSSLLLRPPHYKAPVSLPQCQEVSAQTAVTHMPTSALPAPQQSLPNLLRHSHLDLESPIFLPTPT